MQGSQNPISCSHTTIDAPFVLGRKQKDMAQKIHENKCNYANLITHRVKYEIFLLVPIVEEQHKFYSSLKLNFSRSLLVSICIIRIIIARIIK
jgi:hypothetical protein